MCARICARHSADNETERLAQLSTLQPAGTIAAVTINPNVAGKKAKCAQMALTKLAGACAHISPSTPGDLAASMASPQIIAIVHARK